MHGIEQILSQRRVAVFASRQTELMTHAGERQVRKACRKSREHLAGEFHRPLSACIDDRQQRLGESREIPQGGVRLVAIGIATLPVDGTEHRRRVVGVDERAGSEIDGFSRHRHVVGIHDAMNEAHVHPARDQRRLRAGDCAQ